ncbi:MAG: hypothetical protein WC112_09625, partial [Proteiniphilum sp.]
METICPSVDSIEKPAEPQQGREECYGIFTSYEQQDTCLIECPSVPLSSVSSESSESSGSSLSSESSSLSSESSISSESSDSSLSSDLSSLSSESSESSDSSSSSSLRKYYYVIGTMPGNPCLHVHLGNDRDGDGWVDNAVCDRCPNNSKKQEPGICDCPTLDTPENIADNDGDGVPNCLDKCPNDPKKQEPGVCGCGVPDIDSDGDGTMDCNDICPKDPNKQDRAGWCGCGEDESIDTDRDGYPDCLQVPRLTDVRTMSPVAIEIDVNVELDKETAEDPENYVVTGLPQIPIQRVRLVSSAMIEVVLGEAMVPRQRYTVTFSGVLTAEGEAFEATRSFFGHVPARVP